MAEKAKKMYETLQKFQAMKVRPFETEVERRFVIVDNCVEVLHYIFYLDTVLVEVTLHSISTRC